MIPIISIVGKSNSGKTSFLEAVLPRLKSRGLRVATIKHDVHGFDLDRPGKDTWRHKASGASMVIISSPTKLAVIKDVEEEYSLNQIRDIFIDNIDLILTEGYKGGSKPKIEIHRPAVHSERLCSPERDRLLAYVSNRESSDGEACFIDKELDAAVDVIYDQYCRERGDEGCSD